MSDRWTHSYSCSDLYVLCLLCMYHAARAQSIRRTFSENMAPYVSWSGLSKWIFQPCGSELGARFWYSNGAKILCHLTCVLFHLYVPCNARLGPVLFLPSREERSAGSFPEQWLVVITQRHVTQRIVTQCAQPLLARSVARQRLRRPA